jgi:superfamily II DNA or RNA helicase
MLRPRADLHPYQRDAVAFLKASDARQLIAVMGAGKTTVAEHAIADLKRQGELDRPALVVAPLLIAETVWHAEAQLWQDTADLQIERIIGTPKQRLAAR